MKTIIFSLIISFLLIGCGTNKAEPYAPTDLKGKAELKMEAGKFLEAEKLLAKLLEKEPNNYEARALYSANFAAQAGVTMKKMLESIMSGGGGNGGPTLTFLAALPAFSEENSILLQKALENLNLIPDDSKSDSVKMQAGIFTSSYSFYLMKKFTNVSGTIDQSTLQNMTEDEAISIIDNLTAAGASFPSSAGDTGKSVDEVVAAINAQSGATTKDKLAAYMASTIK